MRLMERDYLIMQELERWRFLLSRHIRFMGGFPSERSCNQRLKTLADNKYLRKEYLVYGFPPVYTLSHKGKMLIGANKRNDTIRLENLKHDVLVFDTSIFLMDRYGFSLADITTEKELHQKNGFSNRRHQPDFIFTYKEKTFAVEIELNLKAKQRFLKNIKDNYLNFDNQLWIIPTRQPRIKNILTQSGYTDIYILESEVVSNYITERKEQKGQRE